MAPNSCPATRELQKSRLLEELQQSYKGLFVFGLVALIVLGLIAYCIYQIIRIITFYTLEKRRMKKMRTPSARTNILSDTDDNEVYRRDIEPDKDGANDEYVMYTDNINKTVNEFKEYNDKLTTYYKDNRSDQQPPDLVTADVADIDKDNY